MSQIAPGGIATFSIVFTPGAKLPRNASLRIVSNDTSTPLFTVALTGTGIASPNADLAGISLPVPMTISPAFAANVTSYTATTVFNRRSVVITPTALNAISGIKVNGNAVTSGAAAAPINLTTGPNIITIVVTSEDGLHTKTYTLTINRATAAVPGELDFGFDPFANAEVLTSAQQFDGKAVIGGRFVYGGADLNEVGNLSRQGLGRITPDGSYDSYNPLFYGGQIYALQLLANGQTLASGSFAPWSGAGSVLSNSIALLNADGSRVATFDPVSDAVALQMVGVSGGKFIIVGDFTWLKPNGAAVQTSRNHIARINADGSLDTAFNPNVNGIVRSVVAQPDGKAVIGGSFTMVGATARINVARITATGDVDATFTVASEVDDRVNCLALQPDGKILVGGVFVAGDGLVRLNANGSLDATFTPQTPTGGRQPLTLALQENGKIIVGGYGDSGRSAIERQNADGTLDTSFAASIADGASPGWVNTISIQDTGRMVVGGRFSSVNGINRRNVARIDGATPQTLAPVTGSLIEWSRGGLPPATATAFDVSSDNGATWTVVDSTGTYVNGVWQGTITTPLPVTGGLLRGRATIAGGQYGEMSFQTPYSLPAADIVVEQPVNTVLTDGDTINFGSLGLNVLNQIPFTVRNAGGQALTGVSVTITGANANQFSVIDQPDTSVAPLDSTTFTIQAKLTALGAKTAILHVASNDPDENPFDITVNATGVAANLPAATTVSATSAFVNVAGNDVVNATLNGMVDANSLPRDVVFDYGPTTAYGTTVPATNPTENGADPVPVTVALTGLLQHTTYHYRVRAVSDLGNATGLDKTFLTPNHAPVAKDDTAINLPSAAVTIDVLDNDSDGDWDNLIISAKSAVTPATAGTMAIVSNQLVFTASAVFGNAANPKATFTYTVSDGFGGTDTGSVTVNPGSATIAPTASPVLTSASQSYTVAITTLGSWAVTEALTWASVSPSKGIGDGVHPQNVIVTVDANPGLAQRGGPTTGVIKIGGVSHTITQAGVLAPVVSPAVLTGTSTGGPFNTVVGDNGFSVTIPCSNFPVTFSVASGTLPPGLILNTTTGVISGIPTTGGNAASPTKAYPLTIKATNAKSSSTTPSFTINVDALPANAVGTFHGYVKPSATARMTPDPHLGGRFEMTTQSNGAFTGQIYEGVAKKSFSGTLFATFATKLRPSLSAPVTGTSYTLDLTLDATNNTLAGTLHDAGTNTTDVSAWRNTWSATAPINKATRFAGQHNFFMQNTDTANGPQGYGYGSFIVSETTGALTITGKLADETKTTATAITTTFIGPQGQVLFYLPLYSNHGACSGILTVDPTIVGDNQTQGSLKWVKPASPSTPKDTVYASGFGPLTVAVEGNPYVAPAKGERVMGAPSSTSANNATLSFTQGGLSPNFTQGLLIKNPSTTGLTNTATVPSPNPNKVAMPVLTAPTGLFNGNFVIAGTAARTAPFYGLIVRDVTGMSDTTKGYGFLLLPSVPTGTETVATSPKLSGRVELAP